jgi:2-amino-4-hydroxy-6-hydroxymethyldihydropteridine diphosphokinase
VSRLYSTTPVSDVEQPDFFNAAALIDTEIAAVELLAHLHRIEAEHGRERLIHWGPRTLDLDLIDFEGFVSTSADLHVPHPRAGERQFVLQPIADVSPAWALNGTAVAELVAQTEDVVIAADFGWAQS